MGYVFFCRASAECDAGRSNLSKTREDWRILRIKSQSETPRRPDDHAGRHTLLGGVGSQCRQKNFGKSLLRSTLVNVTDCKIFIDRLTRPPTTET
jgi:hypothetical protein